MMHKDVFRTAEKNALKIPEPTTSCRELLRNIFRSLSPPRPRRVYPLKTAFA